MPTEAAGASSVPFTTQEEGQEKENVAEEKREEVKVEPFSIQEETHKQLEELKTRQPAEVRPCIADLDGTCFLSNSIISSDVNLFHPGRCCA